MPMLAKVLLLLGFLPGTVLPTALADRLIVPAIGEEVSDNPESAPPLNPGSMDDTPDSSPISAEIPISFTCTRPTGFAFAKSDLRPSWDPRLYEAAAAGDFQFLKGRSLVPSRLDQVIGTASVVSHRITVTARDLTPHAPPLTL